MKSIEPSFSNALSLSTFDYWFDVSTESPPLPDQPSISEEEPLVEDLWSFDFFWQEISQTFSSIEQLYAAIKDLYQRIRQVKEKFRSMAQLFPKMDLEPNEGRGVSGSYFLIDEQGKRRYIIKPLDEDVGCIHNQGFASPFTLSPFRVSMPLYLSSLREVLAYQIAVQIGVGSLIPKTTLGIFESSQFHDFSKGIATRELSHYLETCGETDPEKLCSVQEYVDNPKSLFEALHELEMMGLNDEEIAARFDQDEFEDANLLLWTTYDTDGHMGNFLVYPKGTDKIGNEVLGLKKIDNGFAFPDKNKQLRNNLAYLPNAQRELSERGKEKIAAMQVDQLAQQFEIMGLGSAIPALYERISYLKKLAQEPGITLKEMNNAMTKVGKKK